MFVKDSTSGRVRAIEAQQLLRSAQVGGLPDARLELNVYDLLLRQGRPVDPWIGEEVLPRELTDAPQPTPLEALLSRPPRRRFARAESSDATGFLSLRSARFEELGPGGEVLHAHPLEYVVPSSASGLGAATVATALLLRRKDTFLLGIDDDDLPAAQCFTGHSELLMTPAWRLPKGNTRQRAAREWILARLAAEYGIDAGEVWTLGGSYHPSPGSTPEVVYPWAVEVRATRGAGRALHWVALHELVEHRAALRDGHLRIAALRAAHALGVLPGSSGVSPAPSPPRTPSGAPES